MTKRSLVCGYPGGSSNSAALLVSEGMPEDTERTSSTGLLTSFWYYAKFDFSTLGERVPLVLDSGAFSAYTSGGEVSLRDYAAWATDLRERIDFAFNLDVLGDPASSLANWHALREMGLDSVPVLHFGDRPQDVLPAYLDITDPSPRIALGGLASGGTTPQALAWTAYVFRWLREHSPHTLTHGLGIHLRSKMARFPWASTDSSSFTSAWRFARATIWDFEKQRWVSLDLRDSSQLHRAARVLRAYGVEPEEVWGGDEKLALVRLMTLSECRAADDWNARHSPDTDRYLVGASRALNVAQRYLAGTSSKYHNLYAPILDEEA